MGLYVNTNVASINAQRRLTKTSRGLSKSFQRLSSGLRINSAADDSAGLAISERLTSQIRGLSQAARNANDGISLVQVAEASLEESSNILQRMRELAVQAANDINTEADRESIQEEIDQLSAELTRIGEQNVFNRQVLLDGSFREQYLQVGMNFREQVKIRVRDARAFNLGRHAVFTGSVSSAALVSGDLVINGLTIRSTTLEDDTFSTSLATSSAIAKVNAINDLSVHTGVEAYINETVRAGQLDVVGGTLDANNYVEINGRIITGFVVDGGDADESLLRAINEEAAITGVEAYRDANNRIELRAVDGRNIEVEVVGAGGTRTGLGNAGDVTLATVTLHSEDLYQVSGADEGTIGFAADQPVGVSTTQVVDTIDVTTRDGASLGLRILDRALEFISESRAELGAVQNRLEATINNLAAVGETASASRSRIRDADFAVETAELTRNQILQSAGTTVLAQANSATQNALSLLQ